MHTRAQKKQSKSEQFLFLVCLRNQQVRTGAEAGHIDSSVEPSLQMAARPELMILTVLSNTKRSTILLC